MILVDVNLLVYSRVSGLPQHRAAREWLDGHLNGPGRVALPWPCLLGYLRLVTNRRVFSAALAPAVAWGHVEDWLDRPAAWVPVPGPRHREVFEGLMRAVRPTGDLVPDTHLAALALEHGLTLCSTDGDFARFPGLRWEDPLAPG